MEGRGVKAGSGDGNAGAGGPGFRGFAVHGKAQSVGEIPKLRIWSGDETPSLRVNRELIQHGHWRDNGPCFRVYVCHAIPSGCGKQSFEAAFVGVVAEARAGNKLTNEMRYMARPIGNLSGIRRENTGMSMSADQKI